MTSPIHRGDGILIMKLEEKGARPLLKAPEKTTRDDTEDRDMVNVKLAAHPDSVSLPTWLRRDDDILTIGHEEIWEVRVRSCRHQRSSI